MKARQITWFVVVALSFVLPFGACAAIGQKYTLSNGETRVLDGDRNTYIVPQNASVVLTQNTSDSIKALVIVKDGACVTLNNVNIRGCIYSNSAYTSYESASSAIQCDGNATIILADNSINRLEGSYISNAQHPFAHPAIQVGGAGKTLTIRAGVIGNGTLTAIGGGGLSSTYGTLSASGIGVKLGEGSSFSCGEIVIEGGVITAKGESHYGSATGISTGTNGDGRITIKDTITKVVSSMKGLITIGTHLKQTKSGDTITLTPMVYTIQFDSNGGDNSTSKNVSYGKMLGSLPTSRKLGYALAGWFTAKDGGSRITEETTASADVTYYAKWVANKHIITFDANGGEGDASETLDYDAVIGDLPEPTRGGYAFIGWYSARDGGDRISPESIVSGDATYYAHWVAAPYAFGGDADWTVELDGSWKSGAIVDSQTSSMEMKVSGKCRVSFRWKCSCEPLVKGNPYDYLSFAIDGVQQKFICGETDWADVTTDVRSRGSHTLRWTYIKDAEGAVGEDCAWVSDVSVSEIPPETFGDFLNCPGRTLATGGDGNWVLDRDVSADGYALRSGEVTHSQTSRLETVVYGAGTIAFRCKVDGEIVKKIVYDGLAFCVDGEQQGDLMGDADWTEKTFTVTGDGRHVLSWLYVKDEEGDGGGADCAWLDNVVWTPDDPLPPLDVTATDDDANAIIAELSDSRLSDSIVGKSAYIVFRNWVDSNGLSHALVKDAPEAWLSYVLDAPGLMAKPEPLTSEDVVIESIAPSSTASGTFDLAVSVGGVVIGEGARLAEVLGIEGAAELDESAFSSEGLAVSLGRATDGKAKVTVTPDGAPPSFFLRVRVK